ncbi:MAG: UvrD-helicase domain-containing protein [bacterium]
MWLNKHKYQKYEVLYKSPLNENDELEVNINKNTKTYKALYKMKKDLMDKGILSFSDAYIFARKYINKYPIIKLILQNRFRYVFVDEMQDMNTIQCELLEKIFYDSGNSKSIYQRIGDRNQSIFSEDDKEIESPWNYKGRNALKIIGSHRFSKEIADIVKCFSVDMQEIKGNSSHKSIKPYLIIYKHDTINKILPKFVDIIKQKKLNNELPSGLTEKIKAIGWRKKIEYDKKDKISIKHYCPEFNEMQKVNKIDYSTLKDYLFNIQNKSINSNGLRMIRDNILNAFLKLLRYEEIKGVDGRYYSRRKLLDYIKDINIELYQDIKLQLYLWSKEVYQGNADYVYKEIKEYVPKFLSNIFEKDQGLSEETNAFINNDDNNTEIFKTNNRVRIVFEKYLNNCFKYNGIDVEVGTVHSIKGETHLATLYMETFFQGKYESQWLKSFFKGNFATGREKINTKKALKMAYVGMSRPKYLLCVAVNYENVKDYLDDIPDDKWIKIRI